MGCSASKLEDEESVQLCKDRRNFIKQAVDSRIRFATGHMAYIQSLKRVSVALRSYVDGDEHHDFYSDSYSTPPFTPVKRLSPEISVPTKTFSLTPNQSTKSTIHVMRYLKSSGNPSISVEECPQSPEIVRINSYYPMEHYGVDGFFSAQASPINSAFAPSPYNRPSYPPQSPQNSQWDFFWNPFSSLDTYGFPSRYSLDRIVGDEDTAGLRQVREAEGIPELEEDGEGNGEESFIDVEIKEERPKVDMKPTPVAADIEEPDEINIQTERVHEVKEFMAQGMESIEVSQPPNAVELEVTKGQEVAGNREAGEETPGFTVYMNRRPASMAEVMKDLEIQFLRICDAAHEVSVMLEASRAQYSSSSSELAVRMLNPVALFRSGSSRSSSSRFLSAASAAPSSRDEGYETSSEYSEESCMISGSHQSTLDRLYAWEKKLYEEVKCGEKIRRAYEKKCMQLRNQDVNGDEPASVDRTRATIRDLHTRLKVSIQSVESISMRIEKLRDEELHPQLIELIQGLARMWRGMAECHRIQKRTIDEAKVLLLSSSTATAEVAAGSRTSDIVLMTPAASASAKPSRAACNLEAALRSWRACLEIWTDAQRSYARALASWILRCGGGAAAVSPLSPRRSGGGGGAPPVLGVCVQWSRLLDSISEAQVIDGLDFFAAGIGSVSSGGGGDEAAAAAMAADRAAEMAGRVLWAGMSVAVGSLMEFAAISAEGYEALAKRCTDERREDGSIAG